MSEEGEKWTVRIPEDLQSEAETYLREEETVENSKSDLVRNAISSHIRDGDLETYLKDIHRLGSRKQYDEAERLVDQLYEDDPEIAPVFERILEGYRKF